MRLDPETIRLWKIPDVPARFLGRVDVIITRSECRAEIYIFVPAKPKPVRPGMKWSDRYLAHDPEWEELYVRWVRDDSILTHEEYVNK